MACRCTVTKRSSGFPGLKFCEVPDLSELTPKLRRSVWRRTEAEAFERLCFVWILGHHSRRVHAQSAQHYRADSYSSGRIAQLFPPRRLQGRPVGTYRSAAAYF
jgi:hypothetical protein